MGVNLVPTVSNFQIVSENFDDDNESVKLGCAPPGQHRIMRFDLYCNNRGNEDLVIGNPADHPEIFERSDVFGWQFKDKFYTYNLKNDSGVVKEGYKVAFCLLGGKDKDGRPFDCDYQGIEAGKRDLYSAGLPCQFIIIDDLANGDYTLETTANAPSVKAVKTGKGNIIIEEDDYDDNTIEVQLRINGDTVRLLS